MDGAWYEGMDGTCIRALLGCTLHGWSLVGGNGWDMYKSFTGLYITWMEPGRREWMGHV